MVDENPYCDYAEEEITSNYIKKNNVLAYEDDFTEPEKIVSIDNGCPICNSEIKGSISAGYYCEKCNMMFSEFDLINIGKISK